MSFVSVNTGWIADYLAEECYRTTDGGVTWTAIDLPSGEQPQLKFVDAQTGWVSLVIPGAVKVYKTVDAGATWQAQFQVDNTSVRDIEALSPDLAWVIMHNGNLMRTSDGGAGV